MPDPESSRTFKVDCPKQRDRGAALTDRLAVVDLGALDVGMVRLATPRERARFLRDYVGGRRARAARRALCAQVERARQRIDLRESARLPG